MRSTIDAFIEGTLAIHDTGELKRYFENFLTGFDLNVAAYHILAKGFRRLSLEEGFRLSTFPEDYIRYYLKHKCYEFDPVMEKAFDSGGPIQWRQVMNAPSLSEPQKAFFKNAESFGLKDGVAFSIYGRPGDIAYFSLGSTIEHIDFTRAFLLELQAICQHMHMRHEELTEEAKLPKLSRREIQVLELIAQGNTNAAISRSLGLSPNTIDTLVRRSFDKLGVTSRVEAALAAAGLTPAEIYRRQGDDYLRLETGNSGV